MTEITVILSVAMMVAVALSKGHTTRKTTELRRGLARMEAEEKRARGDRDQAEVLQESAEARASHVQHQCERTRTELEELQSQIQQLLERLGGSEDEDDDSDESDGPQNE